MNADTIKSALFGSTFRILGTAVVGLVVILGISFLVGIFGVPTVTGVENQFGAVNASTTVIETGLGVRNPNPVGVALGGASVNYTVFMNDVAMASGLHRGLQVGSGNSTLNFTTYMRNEQIPRWWYTHIRNDEETQVLIDARVRSSLLGGRTFELPQERTVETDLVSAFNSEETRPVTANQPLVSDPVLYINETNAAWDDENLTPQQTPIDMSFVVYNPKPYPYTVTEIGYNITMNGVPVGEGGTQRNQVIPPGGTATIQPRTVIDNDKLDDWWVSHLQRNQVTELRIDFAIVVDPDTSGVTQSIQPFRLPVNQLDYNETIETDIFGTKPEDGSTSGGSGTSDESDGGDDTTGDSTTPDDSDGSTDDGSGTETPTDSPTPTDDGGLLGGGSDEPTSTDEPTPAPTESPTPSPTDDGGGILGDLADGARDPT